jgi:hypothetical protein
MCHARSVDAGDIWELRGRHSSKFLNLGHQAEAWIATGADGMCSHDVGQQYLDQLKHGAACDEDKYYASVLVLKDDIERCKVASTCPEECIDVTVTLALSGERIRLGNFVKTDHIYDLKQHLKVLRPLSSKANYYTIVQNTTVLHDSAVLQDVLRSGDELKAVVNSFDLFSESILDELFEQCVTCEGTEALKITENNVWNVEKRNVSIPPEVRFMALKFMQYMALKTKLATDAWFNMVTIFDAYCLRSAKPISLDMLPALCAAIIRLVIKMDDQLVSTEEWIIEEAPKLADWLIEHGHVKAQPSISFGQMELMEVDVVESLQWRLHSPSVFKWSNLFMARYSVFTRHRFDTSLGCIWKHILAQMEFFVLSLHVPDLAPRQVSVGLFFLGLVSANLMPVKIVFPDETDEVRTRFLASLQNGAGTLQDIVDGHYHLLCQLIETTICASMSSLQKDCRCVAMAIQRFQKTEGPRPNSL